MKRMFFGLIMGASTYFAMNAALHDSAVAIALGAAMFAVGFAAGGRVRC